MKKSSKKRSQDQENYIATVYGGRASPSSGASETDPGDVIAPPFLISCKSTVKKSISLKRDDWDEAERDSVLRGLRPAMALRLIDEENPFRTIDLIVRKVDDDLELYGGVDNVF